MASEFYVDGTTIPEVNFDVGPSWSGLLPISGNANETRKVPNHNLYHGVARLTHIDILALLLVLSSWPGG